MSRASSCVWCRAAWAAGRLTVCVGCAERRIAELTQAIRVNTPDVTDDAEGVARRVQPLASERARLIKGLPPGAREAAARRAKAGPRLPSGVTERV